MNEKKAEKLFVSITDIDDDIVEEAQSSLPRKKRMVWRKWCAAAACICLVAGMLGAGMCFRRKVDPAVPFAGRESIAIEGLWAGGMGVGEGVREYDTRRYDTGEGVSLSPVKDAADAETMSVYRSVKAESSADLYRLILIWAKELAGQAKAGLGMKLRYETDAITLYNEPYDANAPLYDKYMYWMDLEMDYNGTPLKLSCVSESNITYYDLDGIETLYEAWCGEPFPVLEEPEDEELLTALEPVVSFVNSLTGGEYTLEKTCIRRLDAHSGPRINLNVRSTEVLGSELSWQMVTEQGGTLYGLSISLQSIGEGKYRLDRVSISEVCRTYIGEYPIISLAEAEERLHSGYTFGGIHCPVCKSEDPAVDFSEYDLVQVEYYGAHLMEYALPYYAFYKHIGIGEYPDGGAYEDYAVVYVPAVELEGVEEYFQTQAEQHHAD